MKHCHRLAALAGAARFIAEPLECRVLLDATPVGSEFSVNSYTTDNQRSPSVAMNEDGEFVIAWNGEGVGDGSGIFAHRFNASGQSEGAAFLVNVSTTFSQGDPCVAIDDDGDFVVAWTSYEQDGSQQGIYARRFDSLGVAQGGEFLVNTSTTNRQQSPAIAMDEDGDFVVAWQSGYGQDGSTDGIFAQ
jgi:predicted  nucleic acid-binding Zn-ribbon protein